MTKDYFIDHPSLALLVSFLSLSMPNSNFLTAILRCFLPLGSHDSMQRRVGPLWVIPLLVSAVFYTFIFFLTLPQISAFMKWNLNSVSDEMNNKKVEIVRWRICLDTEGHDST